MLSSKYTKKLCDFQVKTNCFEDYKDFLGAHIFHEHCNKSLSCFIHKQFTPSYPSSFLELTKDQFTLYFSAKELPTL